MIGAILGSCSNRVAALCHAINCHRRDVRDALIIGVLAIAVMAISIWANLFEEIHVIANKYEFLQIDELFVVASVLTVALLVFSHRRLQDLRHEIAARRDAEDDAQRLARHDPLTGLPNRRYFNERLEQALAGLARHGQRCAVLLLDLNGFKTINDVHGHQVGDRALIEFAERIQSAAEGALVARVGGDEFAVIMPNVSSLFQPTTLAHHISTVTAEPFVIADNETTLGVCIGIAVAPDDGTTGDEIVRRADLALYRAKAKGHSTTRFFEHAMDVHVERRNAIERELRSAVATEAIQLYYQPIVQLGGGCIVGFEALARWHNAALGRVPPNIFIAIAEECGLIHRLGDQLLRQACRDAKQWPGNFTLAFNISPLQLRDPTFGLRVLGILGESNFPPGRLELEITESAIVGDAQLAQKQIDELRAVGVRIALDDFGTGYATMSQLLAFRFDKIKIDRSFVDKLGGDADSDVIVRAIIGLAKGLGLVTTAEGIERPAQLVNLKADGCIEGQGYLFGQAIPAEHIPALLGLQCPADAVA